MPSLEPLSSNRSSLAQPETQFPLVVILGPTAAGKTALAIQLAERLNGEIVSADSRLFYRGMDIGTAKPSPQERATVPHHLIDVTTPDHVWSLAVFQSAASQVIKEIALRGKLPFLVGGTGQYIYAVTQGWEIPPVMPDLHLRNALEHWAEEITPVGLHTRLSIIDPQAARQIDPQNLRRTIRALEVILSTGRLFSSQSKRTSSPYHLLQIGLKRPRQELYARIDARIDGMLQGGLVDEVKGLLSQGYAADLPPFSAIGYREIIAYLQGSINLDEAVVLMKRQSRVFVRRQANWFKESDPSIHWYNVQENTLVQIENLITEWRNHA